MPFASGPANVTAFTSVAASAVASAAKPRRYLGIYNQSADTVFIAFDRAAVAADTAGQVTLQPLGTVGSSVEWNGNFVPSNQVNIIGSAAGALVTILE
jgi:hypothetical protein